MKKTTKEWLKSWTVRSPFFGQFADILASDARKDARIRELKERLETVSLCLGDDGPGDACAEVERWREYAVNDPARERDELRVKVVDLRHEKEHVSMALAAERAKVARLTEALRGMMRIPVDINALTERQNWNITEARSALAEVAP